MPGRAEPRPRHWIDLRPRAVSAALLAAATLACLWAGAAAWALLVMLVAAGLALEWVRLCGARPARLPGLLVPVAAILPVVAAAADRPGWAGALLAAGFAACWAASRRWVLAAGVVVCGRRRRSP